MPDPAPFVHTAELRWVDLDALGVLNNAVYLTLLEEARRAWCTAHGLMRAGNFPFLLGETRVRYLEAIREPGPVEVSLRVVRVGTKSFDTEYAVERGGVRHAAAWATLVWIDGAQRSAPVPDAVRALVAPAGA